MAKRRRNPKVLGMKVGLNEILLVGVGYYVWKNWAKINSWLSNFPPKLPGA